MSNPQDIRLKRTTAEDLREGDVVLLDGDHLRPFARVIENRAFNGERRIKMQRGSEGVHIVRSFAPATHVRIVA